MKDRLFSAADFLLWYPLISIRGNTGGARTSVCIIPQSCHGNRGFYRIFVISVFVCRKTRNGSLVGPALRFCSAG